MRRISAHGLAIVLSVVSLGAAQGPTRTGSGGTQKPAAKPPGSVAQKKPASKAKAKPYQVGTASWYGREFQGKTTASGEPFNMYDLTAAHLRLPLGSFVKVTNLRNSK